MTLPFVSRRVSRITSIAWVLLAACASEHKGAMDAGDGRSVSVRVGTEGGEVKLPSGHGVTIPPGALEDDTTIDVEVVDALPPLPSGYVAAGDALSISPAQLPLAAPVTLQLPYMGAPSAVFRLDGPNDTTWELVTGATFSNGTATLEVTQLGIYVVARRGSGMIVIDAGGESDGAIDASVVVDASTNDAGGDAAIDASTMDASSDATVDAAVADAVVDDDAGTTDTAPADAGVDASTPMEVLNVDFETSVPDNVDVGGGVLTPAQGFANLGFGDTFLRGPTGNTITITFTDLPAHAAISIDFLFAAIDSLDGTGSFPAGDFFRVQLDGVTIFRESFANAIPSQIQSYVPAPGVELARHEDLGFSGPGGYYTDSAYDFGKEPFFDRIPHTASSATLTFTLEGMGVQDINDESWAIDNLRVTTHTETITPLCSDVVSTFESGVDGWTQTGASVFEQRATGGNPNGLLYVDTSDNAITYVFAGAQFLGDHYTHNGGELRFDANMLEGGGSAWTSASQDHGWVRISAGSDYAEVDLVPGDMGPSLASWTTYTVPLTAEAWGKTGSEWRALLSNVTEVRVCLEGLYGAEVQALDNVALRCEAAPTNDQ